MHDTFLFENIWDALKEISLNNNIEYITYLEVIVHTNSHVNNESLYNHLISKNSKLIDNNTVVLVKREEIEELTAIISSVEGDMVGD